MDGRQKQNEVHIKVQAFQDKLITVFKSRGNKEKISLLKEHSQVNLDSKTRDLGSHHIWATKKKYGKKKK